MASQYKVITSLYASTFKTVGSDGNGKFKNNTLLMGSYVKILSEAEGEWQKVLAFNIEGWIKNSQLGDSSALKIFYIDVGQGDCALLEVGAGQPGKGLKVLIDGGPGDNLSRYLSKWQYKYYFNKDIKIHFDYVFISHFDKDHYQGLIDIINDQHYTFGKIYHNGIAKFNKKKESYPDFYNCNLGVTVVEDGEKYLKTFFSTIDQLVELRNNGGMLDLLEKFSFAIETAVNQGRVEAFERLDQNSVIPDVLISDKNFKIDVLGPVSTEISGETNFKYFEDEAHTINGHSIVLKISYGQRSFLFGGDLNIPSENHLIKHYEDNNPFEVDVAKSCHHGSTEFTTQFMAKVNPHATVISSGDNESFSHPRADAIGCAGKYSKSKRPLVFSTELARSSNVETNKILFGMINLRCNGDEIIMAQMKEAPKKGQVWDLYESESF